MGGKYLGNSLECRSQDSQVIPNQACRFRNFFLGPIPELFLQVFRRISRTFKNNVDPTDPTLFFAFPAPGIASLFFCQHDFLNFLEMQQIMLGQLGRHYFLNFLEMRRNICREKFRNGAQKKVPESAGLVGDDLAVP